MDFILSELYPFILYYNQNFVTSSYQKFWGSFYKKLEDSLSRDKKTSSAAHLYHDAVIKLLRDSKEEYYNGDDLVTLQKEIEDLSMNFNEQSIFTSVPNLIKLLIREDMITAKDYLIRMCDLSEIDQTYIKVFGKYTLEAIIIYVLGYVFNPLRNMTVVRVSTLIIQIDNTVRVQAVNMGMNKEMVKSSLNKEKKKSKVSRSHYPIGICLVEFLVEIKLITLQTDTSLTGVLPV